MEINNEIALQAKQEAIESRKSFEKNIANV